MSDLPTLKESEVLKVASNLTKEQVQKFFSKTPESKIRQRPAKGGGQWSYVSGSYVTQVLNSLFGFDWSFTIDTSMEEALKTASTGTVVVKGTLKVRIGDTYVTKEQYGRKDIAFRKGTKEPLDFGNDLKAAATDAKKKCASELGLFADVYSQEDFFEAEIVDVRDNDIIEEIQKSTSPDELKQSIAKFPADVQKSFAKLAAEKLKELQHVSAS